MMNDVFEYPDYPSFLSAMIAERSTQRGFQARLAQAAKCQASYLSQALRGRVELTPEHGIRIAVFLGLDRLGTKYFLNLIHHARASSPELRHFIKNELDALKKSRSSLTNRFLAEKAEAPKPEIEARYFSSWLWGAIHVATSIEGLSNAPALAQHFGLSEALVLEVLHQLENWQMVRLDKGRWKYVGQNLHLPDDSLSIEPHHSSWRARANQSIVKRHQDAIHYTSTFTMARGDAKKLRAHLIECVERSRAIIEPSEPEEVFCLGIDFFRA